MLSTLLQNLIDCVVSMPTNMIILACILGIAHFVGKVKIKDCLKIAAGYILIVFICGCFGYSLPSLLSIGKWIVAQVTNLWNKFVV
jgi:hypothetical protein